MNGLRMMKVGVTMMTLLLVCCAGLYAGSKKEEVKLTIVPFLWKNEASSSDDEGKRVKDAVYYLKEGSHYKKLTGADQQFGKSVKYRGSPTLSVYHKGVDERKRVSYMLVAEVTVLLDTKKLMLFILGGSNDKLSVLPVNISKKSLPDGGVLLLNATKIDIRGTVWDKEQDVVAGSSHLFYQKFESPDTKISIGDIKNGKKLYSIVTRITDSRPYVVIFYQAEGRRKAYRLKMLRDINLI